MADITGIELGPNCCVLVRAGGDGSQPTVAAARAVTPSEWSQDHDGLVNLLRSARRTNRLSAHARVVAWGLSNSHSTADLSHLPELSPLVAAGFEIDAMVSPVQALADVARARQAGTGDAAVAALSLNHHGVAIAIIARGAVVASRVFDWPLGRPFSGGRAEQLERYLIISQLAPELRHLIDFVRPVHGVRVTSAIACGNLPNLRSISMLLIEELDLEVETLDSAELLEPTGASRFVDLVPALQLAASAAARPSEHTASVPTRRGSSPLASISLAALALCVAFSVVAVADSSPARPVFRDGLGAIAAGIPPVPDLPAEATTGRVDATPRAPIPESRVPSPEPRVSNPEPRAPNPDPRSLPRLDGIMIAGARRLAIIDGRIVSVGNSVGQHVVIRIEGDGAVVLKSRSGREIRLSIRGRPPSDDSS